MTLVLFADDDQTALKVIEKALPQFGFEVICCEDGLKAWEYTQCQPLPDILLLDWHMPGHTGLELCEMHQHSTLPFMYKIVMSGFSEKEQLVTALHSGAHDLIPKPIDVALIEQRLRVGAKIVEERRAGDEAIELLNTYTQHLEELVQERAKQLVHAERMSSLGVMSAGIAHEINNPMSFISGNVQCLKMFWNDLQPLLEPTNASSLVPQHKLEFISAEIPKIFDGMMKGVERVTSIVQGLKKFAGKRSEDMSVVDVNASIHQALEIAHYSLGKNVAINLDLSSEPMNVNGNSVELEQVLINLLVNAGQAMEHTANPTIALSAQANMNSIEIKVVDNGPGIPEQNLEKIWTPFFTTKAPGKGTGLGLSISAGIVQRHGGTFSAENLPEGGARFSIRLPAL